VVVGSLPRMVIRASTFMVASLSLWMLWSRGVGYAGPVFILGCLTLAAVGYREAVRWGDLLNPITVLLVLCGLRFALPTLLISINGEPKIEVIQLMSLEPFDWQLGQMLALAGVAGLTLGWLLVPTRSGGLFSLDLRGPRGAHFVGVLSMCVGILSLLLFVGKNAVVDEAIVAGLFRETSVEAGTGQYFFLSLALISGSVVASRHLIARRPALAWASLIPVAIATLSFFVLGGRVRAAVPLIGAGLLVWYTNQERRGWGRVRLLKTLTLIVVALVVATWFGHLGRLYREGGGLGALEESLSLQGLSDYLDESVYVDVGQLHTLAGATALGEGAAGSLGFVGAITWPVSDFLNQPTGGAGVFILEKTSGMEFVAGLHPTLIGDAYLSLGFVGLVVITVGFGAITKLWYVRFRSGRIDPCLYVVGHIYLVRLLLESVDKWGETIVVLLFTLSTLAVARFLFGVEAHPVQGLQPLEGGGDSRKPEVLAH
jgi:hypothetical protein